MREVTSLQSLFAHTHKPLVVLGGLARTFGTMASFLAALLLIPGLYLIEDALAHPLEAQGAGLIAGAFIIALASLMLFFVFKPR
jgi:hypothetical protein